MRDINLVAAGRLPVAHGNRLIAVKRALEALIADQLGDLVVDLAVSAVKRALEAELKKL